MSKPLFFTGRKEIKRTDVAIRLFETHGEPSRFEARIDLTGYGLPADSLVVAEAYHNTYFERFQVGAVSSSPIKSSFELKGLEPGDVPLFRVKVTALAASASGRLLAAIDEVRPSTEDNEGAASSLLPLIPKTRSVLGDEFWRVHFVQAEELQPELWINREVQGLFAAIQNQDPRITALIMPEVLRQVLRGLVGHGAPYTEEGKLGQWLEFAREFHPDAFEEWDEDNPEGSRQKRYEWVDITLKQFAASHRFFDRYHEQAKGNAVEIDDA